MEPVTQQPPEALEVAEKTAKPVWQHPMLWFAIAIIAVLFVVFMTGNHSPADKKKGEDSTEASVSAQEVNDQLRMNLAKLNASMKQAKAHLQHMTSVVPDEDMYYTPRVERDNHETTVPVQRHSQVDKQLAVRRNMPTSMYSAAPTDVGSTNPSGDSTRQATLSGKDPYSAFANRTSSTTAVDAKKIAHPNYTIAEGELLHGVLETPINSDLPGMVRAVVNQPIYAYTGDKPLIPSGARLIGQYASMVRGGQDRAFVVWNRVILPNGVSVALNSPGADQLGRAGMGADTIDHHFFERFGNATLLSVIGAGAANVGVTGNDRYNSAAAYRQAIAESFQQSASDALDDASDIKNTLNIHQGRKITVFVAHDLSFYQVLKEDES